MLQCVTQTWKPVPCSVESDSINTFHKKWKLFCPSFCSLIQSLYRLKAFCWSFVLLLRFKVVNGKITETHTMVSWMEYFSCCVCKGGFSFALSGFVQFCFVVALAWRQKIPPLRTQNVVIWSETSQEGRHFDKQNLAHLTCNHIFIAICIRNGKSIWNLLLCWEAGHKI